MNLCPAVKSLDDAKAERILSIVGAAQLRGGRKEATWVEAMRDPLEQAS